MCQSIKQSICCASLCDIKWKTCKKPHYLSDLTKFDTLLYKDTTRALWVEKIWKTGGIRIGNVQGFFHTKPPILWKAFILPTPFFKFCLTPSASNTEGWNLLPTMMWVFLVKFWVLMLQSLICKIVYHKKPANGHKKNI